MKRFLAVVAGMIACLAATFALLAPVAQAAPAAPAAPAAGASVHVDAIAGCPANTFCLFQNANFTGTRVSFQGHGSVCDFRQIGFHDQASSMINNLSGRVVLYANVGCSGQTYVAQPNSKDSTFVNNNFNDKADGITLP